MSQISATIFQRCRKRKVSPTFTCTTITDVQLVKDGTTIDMEKEVTQEPATEGETTENASEEAETGSEVSEEETTKAVSDSTEEGLTEEESTVEMVDVTHWVFTQDNKTQRVDESDDIHDLLVNMVGLTFNDCADYYADEEEKESYGLTDGATVLTITYQSGEEETTLKLTIGATTEDDAYYYVSMDDSNSGQHSPQRRFRRGLRCNFMGSDVISNDARERAVFEGVSDDL